MQTKTIDDLNKLFKEAEQVDTELLAEQRSNILLYAGEHYSKKGSKFFNRIRDARDIAQEQKLRITKNHTQRICKTYVNNILTYAPGVTAYPHNDTELQSIKAAELNKAVMRDADRRYKLKSFFRRGCEQYIRVGEVFSLITWNPDLGTLVGYEQALDENGEPQVEEDGSPKAGEKAIFSGDFEFKHFLACNVLRDPGSKDINKSPFLVFREMAYVDDLTARLGDDEEKKKLVQESNDVTSIEVREESIGTVLDVIEKLVRLRLFKYLGNRNIDSVLLDELATVVEGIKRFPVTIPRSSRGLQGYTDFT